MSSSQLATYNSCTSRGYSYSTPMQQPVQSVSLINNSYNGLPNSISGEWHQMCSRGSTKPVFASDYYLQSVPQSTTSPSLPCSSGGPRRFDTSHSIGSQFYNWDPSSKIFPRNFDKEFSFKLNKFIFSVATTVACERRVKSRSVHVDHANSQRLVIYSTLSEVCATTLIVAQASNLNKLSR